MFAEISDAQRQALAVSGTPLPFLDRRSGRPYALLSVNLTPASVDGVKASVEGVSAVGEGDTPDDAILALIVAIKSLQDPSLS